MVMWIFVKICTLITQHLRLCTWNFHIDWITFLYFTGFFLFFGFSLFFITRNAVLKIMKNFDLKMENVLFLNWNFVFTVMIYHILKKLCFLKFASGEDVVLKIHFAGGTVVLCTCLMLFFLLIWAKAKHLSFDLQCFKVLK